MSTTAPHRTAPHCAAPRRAAPRRAPHHPPTNVSSHSIDGDTTTLCHNSGGGGWLQVDLGASYEIGTLEVYNRDDCCQSRIDGALIELWTGSGQTGDKVWSSVLDYTNDEDFPFSFNVQTGAQECSYQYSYQNQFSYGCGEFSAQPKVLCYLSLPTYGCTRTTSTC